MTQPRHYDPTWRWMPLSVGKTPIKGCSLRERPELWEGSVRTWEELSEWTDTGQMVGLLVGRLNLVVLDCDTRSGWDIGEDGVARLASRHGIDDLRQTAVELGQTIEPTFTVRTRSGGLHLYYRQNPHCPVKSRGQREGWTIDVKASENAYVAAPPSPGYEVIRDLPVAWLPYWLARHVRGLHQRTKPLGSGMAGSPVPIGRLSDEGGMLGSWVTAQLARVTLADRVGGWNSTIYQVSRDLFDAGLTLDDVVEDVVAAAQPWDDRQRKSATATVESAWRGHLDGEDGET